MPASLTIRIDDEMLHAVDELAKQTERSRDVIVREALHDYVETQRWQLARIQAGLDDVAAGRFATAEELYLVGLTPLLSEWDSPEDDEAYNGL